MISHRKFLRRINGKAIGPFLFCHAPFHCCRSISAKLTGIKKEKDNPLIDRLKIGRNCIKTIDCSISIHILMLHSNFNAFTSSWYLSNTYHSPVIVHETATYCIRSTPMYWSRSGRNRYGTDTYLLSSYSRSIYLFRTRYVATNLVTSLEIHPIRCANMLCHFGKTRNGYVATSFILVSSTVESSATSGY